MIINDLDGYYIVFDTKNWNTELDTLINKFKIKDQIIHLSIDNGIQFNADIVRIKYQTYQ